MQSFSVSSSVLRIFSPSDYQNQQYARHCKCHPFPSSSINSLGLYLSPECLFNLLSNLYLPSCVENIFTFMVFTFLENAINLGIFIHVFQTTQNSHPSSCYHTLDRLRLHSPSRIFSKIYFTQQQKGVEETMICFITIQSVNLKMTQNIRLFTCCMICNFSNVMVFQFFKYHIVWYQFYFLSFSTMII